MSKLFLKKITQMLPSLRRCAEPMTQSRTVMVKLTLKGNGIYPSLLCTLHVFRTLCTIFVKLHSIVPLGETVCRTHDSATLTQGQGYTSMLWNFAAGDLAVLQTATLFSEKHVLHMQRGKSKHLKSRGLVIGYLICNNIKRTFSKYFF